MWYVQFRKVGKMSHHENNYYNQTYYQTHCGEEYERGNGWEEVFACYAQRIIREICPHSVLDVGCAKGFLVEALRDQGMEAFGIDISEYAVASVRKDIRPFCKVQSVLHPIEGHYDLLTCIEVLEHLDQAEIALAIQHLCAASDDILLSSTPFDYDEESHVSVHTPAYWAEQFAYHGFYHDVQYDCSYISIQAMRFRRVQKSSADLIRDYENELFQKHQELVAARQRYKTAQENVHIYQEAYQKHVDLINQELNPKIADLQQSLQSRLQKMQKEKDEAAQKALEDLKHQMENRCHQKIEEEIKKRKVLEEQYYQKEEICEQLNNCRIELQQAQTTIALLQKRMEHGNHTNGKRLRDLKQGAWTGCLNESCCEKSCPTGRRYLMRGIMHSATKISGNWSEWRNRRCFGILSGLECARDAGRTRSLILMCICGAIQMLQIGGNLINGLAVCIICRMGGWRGDVPGEKIYIYKKKNSIR